MDTLGFSLWNVFGGFASEEYNRAFEPYMVFFWRFAYGLIALVSLMYWALIRDKSEAVAVASTSLLLIWGGLEDVLYYLFMGLPFDASMPWLYDHFFIGNVAKFMGLSTVTPFSLFVSLGLSILILIPITKWLKKARW